MPSFPITSLYAAPLAVLLIALSVRVIGRRRDSGVLLGTGGEAALERAVRAHANFAEYVPIGLVLMLLTEAGSLPWLAHLIGITLTAGRLVHAFSLSRMPATPRLRVAGMTLTFTAMTAGALGAFWIAARGIV